MKEPTKKTATAPAAKHGRRSQRNALPLDWEPFTSRFIGRKPRFIDQGTLGAEHFLRRRLHKLQRIKSKSTYLF
jgi:hypothetical protein